MARVCTHISRRRGVSGTSVVPSYLDTSVLRDTQPSWPTSGARRLGQVAQRQTSAGEPAAPGRQS